MASDFKVGDFMTRFGETNSLLATGGLGILNPYLIRSALTEAKLPKIDPMDAWFVANPLPAAPDPEGPEAARARLAEEARLGAALGYASTILTRPSGLGAARNRAGARLGGF